MASPSQHRRPRSKRAVLVPVALAAVALVVSLVVALRPDGGADAGQVAVKPAPTTTRTTTRPSKPATPRPSSVSPTPKARKTTPSAPASKSPSATSPAKSPSSTGSLAGRIRPGVTYSGVATFYDAGNGDGACTYGPTDDVMTAAMNTADYETSKACGAYVRVRAASGATITVRITNECPAPCAPGQLDLSAQAFAKLATPSTGQIPITWSLLSPDVSAPLSLRYKTGSSQYWCGIQVIGHRNPVARLEVRTGSGWSSLPRTEYNYFLSEQGGGCGAAIRITDIYGEQLTVEGIALRPNVVQPTRVQFARH
ncbi:expansin EXLX1 family cellulose-binding protein [Streptomyces sp. NPDC050803]|uniref:expansin EXLX1 family cellulose-binding protein n=1 Tax=unclassified Streptomyces TaxID=2593676 RepID=UPI00343FCC63